MKKMFFFSLVSFFLNFSVAYSQWTLPNGLGNINNTNSGNVGIGITSPIYKLQVIGKIYNSNGLISNTQLAGGIAGYFLGPSNNNGNVVIQGGAGTGYNAWWLTGGTTVFKIGGNGATEPSTGAINIDYAGKVGIGMTPSFKLDVNSTTRIGATSNTNANIILQGGAGTYDAFWLTSTSSTLKIGGNGGTEPSLGAINIDHLGNVGIGTTNPGTNKLAVEGTIAARKVIITLQNPWPDYVFHKKYKLMPLTTLEKYIKDNSHLPNMPNENEIKKDGIDLAQMNSKLLEKVEELTL